MEDFEVTKMSSRGQIVIPQNIREKMNLNQETKFIVVGVDDTVILKRIEAPKFDRFDEIMKKDRDFAKKKNIKPEDVEKVIGDQNIESKR